MLKKFSGLSFNYYLIIGHKQVFKSVWLWNDNYSCKTNDYPTGLTKDNLKRGGNNAQSSVLLPPTYSLPIYLQLNHQHK